MQNVMEETISGAIVRSYFKKLESNLAVDVAIVGAGPSGLVAARDLALAGLKVAMFESKLAPGGGTWGGGMLMNEVVVQNAAADILHIFTQHDECQTRGIPLGHPVLRKLKMLDEYNVSELVAARDEANTTGIFSAPVGRDGELGEYTEEQDAALTMPSEPGTKIKLEPGWDYKTVTPSHPNRELTAFKNSMLRDIATGLCVEYANFSNDWAGVSFSSVRAGTLAERDHWRMLQAQMVEQFVSPVFNAWLESFLKLAASGSYSSADFSRLSEHEFRGRRWDWVDPMKDVNASVIAVAHNWKTDEQIAADYGCDIDENIEANARLKAKATELGVAPPAPQGTKTTPDNADDKDGEK